MKDLDDFWSLDKLLPKKKKTMSQFSTSEKTVLVTLDGDESKKGKNTISFDSYRTASDNGPQASKYSPDDNKLIKSVEIIPSVDRFDFFDTFRKAALIYYEYKCDKCDFAPFYSYKPQYSQMSTEQKKYYFYWRDMLRAKKYIKTDYSYIYLYVYEILNLPDKIEAEKGLSLLCDVWCAYRRELPKLDVSFSAWIRDYCLLYKLPCPRDRINDFLFDLITVSDFKEFYIGGSNLYSGGGTAAMIAYLSDYDWRRSKYATSDHSGEYRRHLEAAMSRVFYYLLANEKIAETEPVKFSGTAFPGSLCTHSVKCMLSVEYYPLSGVPMLKAKVTAALKYTENKLRAMLGVRSRLAVKDIPEEFKTLIDRYFDGIFERIRKEERLANVPEYQKLYDAPNESISYESAAEIEKSSWSVTARLVGNSEDSGEYITLGGEGIVSVALNEEKYESAEAASSSAELSALSDDDKSFLKLLLGENFSAAKALLLENAAQAESVVERINEYFYEALGDVVIEAYEDFYHIIEDYTEEIENWKF